MRKLVRFDNLKSMFGLTKTAMAGFALDESIIKDTDSVSIADVWGWHFYARLRIDRSLVESEDADAENKLIGILNRYTSVSDGVVAEFGDEVVLLEHQGEMLHFHLSIAEGEVEKVKLFASMLAVGVKKYVIPADGVYGFSMGAQYGRSVVLLVPSANNEDSAYSRVSLGPCANSPAKRVIRNRADDDWTLSYRKNDEDTWTRLQIDLSFANSFIKESSIAMDAAPIEKSARRAPVTRYGYMFRADQDGFTKRVRMVFENGNENEVDKLVNDFLSFMAEVNDWQKSALASSVVVSCPWSGDCCNMLIAPNPESGESEAEASRNAISRLPDAILASWEDFKKRNSYDKSFAWSYGMAEGRIKIIIRSLDGRDYRLFVGWPVGVSLEAVNLECNEAEDLVMHQEDVERMTSSVKGSFKRAAGNYYVQTKGARTKLKVEQINAAAAMGRARAFAGVNVQPARPYLD